MFFLGGQTTAVDSGIVLWQGSYHPLYSFSFRFHYGKGDFISISFLLTFLPPPFGFIKTWWSVVCCIAVPGEQNGLRSWTSFLEVRGSMAVFRGRPLRPSRGLDVFYLCILASILNPDFARTPLFKDFPK